MRYALIVDGLVVNCVEGDPGAIEDVAAHAGATAVATEDGSPGDRWDGSKFHRDFHMPTPSDFELSLVAGDPWVQVGAPFPIQAELRRPGGDLAPINDLFLVPIDRSGAEAAMVKGVQFSGGVSHVEVVFPTSGYYRITEAGINSRLRGMSISLPTPFEVTVYD